MKIVMRIVANLLHLTERMVPDLLKYDKKYLPREANADDKNCEYDENEYEP